MNVLQIRHVTVKLNLSLSSVSVEPRACVCLRGDFEVQQNDSTAHTHKHVYEWKKSMRYAFIHTESIGHVVEQDYVRCVASHWHRIGIGIWQKHWTEEIRIEFCKFIVYLLSVWVRFGIHLHKHIEHIEVCAHTHTHSLTAPHRTYKHSRDDIFHLVLLNELTQCSAHTHVHAYPIESMGPRSLHSTILWQNFDIWYYQRMNTTTVAAAATAVDAATSKKLERKNTFNPSCTVWFGTCEVSCVCVAVRYVRYETSWKNCKNATLGESMSYTFSYMENNKF